jgi:hypothetical protein
MKDYIRIGDIVTLKTNTSFRGVIAGFVNDPINEVAPIEGWKYAESTGAAWAYVSVVDDSFNATYKKIPLVHIIKVER